MLEAAAVLSTHSHVHAPSTIHVAVHVERRQLRAGRGQHGRVAACKSGADLYAAVGEQEASSCAEHMLQLIKRTVGDVESSADAHYF